MEAFALENVSFAYPGQSEWALSGVDLTVQQGEFLLLCGPSGCGKSTLLRHLKTDLAPQGTRRGGIFFQGRPLEDWDRGTQSRRIGFVGQNPENQIVTDKVWHELAFGLENLGCNTPTIRRRVAEMAAFFGIEGLFHQKTSALSGGQKQLVNLAAVMVLQPSVLILDEPTGQLDPIAAGEFLSVLGKINREMGTTILLSEHRLEQALPLCTRMAVMEEGQLLGVGTPQEMGQKLRGHHMLCAMPAAMRVWAAVDGGGKCPVTAGEGRAWLGRFASAHPLQPLPQEQRRTYPGEVLSAAELWFRYEKEGADVVRGLELKLHKGEFLAVLGGNGAGKTTALKLLAGILKPYRGRVGTKGKAVLLPQDPQTVFSQKTVREDLLDLAETAEAAECVAALCRLEGLLDRHPYDLSGGEQQRAALAKVLLTQPDILLLDEPTKGLDAAFKETLAEILKQLLSRGKSVLMVSHDMDFCARHAHRCALFFDGAIAAEGTPRAFFSGNSFYTTSANRMARELLPEAITAGEIMAACCASPPQIPTDVGGTGVRTAEEGREQAAPGRKRTAMALWTLFPLLLIPPTLWAGREWRYSMLSALVLLECMLPFFLSFEGRKPRARELVLTAALVALGVAGRAALFMLPECKPVMALTVITGAALGSETGFLVGALTMLASNMLLSQGPWTPWQMFAMGLVGALAGLLFYGRRPRRLGLCIFGALSAVLLYGLILNTSSALLWAGELNRGVWLAYLASGLPMDCVHAGATALFLWLGAEPMLEKLERIRVKYGLME